MNASLDLPRPRGGRPLSIRVFLPLAAALAACSPQTAERGVIGPEEGDWSPMMLGATSAQRFGGMPAQRPAAQAEGATASQAAFHYTLPAGWSEAPPKPLRDVYLLAPGGAECWLTNMGPGAGGLEANIDRWRAQLGLAPESAEAYAALPRQMFLGDEAVRVDLTSADGETRLIGLMQFLPDRSRFLRITGPAAAVEAQLAAFDELAATLHDGAGHSHDGGGSQAAAPKAQAPAAPAAGASRGDGLSWRAPESWQPLAPGAFRTVWYQVSDGVQCWISTLSGDGGGVEANLARWHSQFGRPAPSSADIAALPNEQVLGRDALWVDLLGEGAADGMVGVLCSLPASSVYVKIQGPSEEVRAHLDDFRAFCRSLALD